MISPQTDALSIAKVAFTATAYKNLSPFWMVPGILYLGAAIGSDSFHGRLHKIVIVGVNTVIPDAVTLLGSRFRTETQQFQHCMIRIHPRLFSFVKF